MQITSLARLKVWVSTVRFVITRQADSLRLSFAIHKARRRLLRSGPIRVLLDTSVLASAVLHESRWVSTGPQPWGRFMVDTGYAARVPVLRRPPKGAKEQEIRDFEDASFLTGIAHLARLGLITLHSSGELEMEQWRKPAGMMSGYSIFSRTAFEGIEISLLDRLPDMVMGPAWMKLPSLEEQQRDRLKNLDDTLYRGLLKRLGQKSSQDAWHIRTAETFGVYCLLTTDYSLLRSMAAQGRHEPIVSLRTKVLSPKQLGKLLGLLPLAPRHISHQDASSPVRADLYMPDNKRRPSRTRQRSS